MQTWYKDHACYHYERTWEIKVGPTIKKRATMTIVLSGANTSTTHPKTKIFPIFGSRSKFNGSYVKWKQSLQVLFHMVYVDISLTISYSSMRGFLLFVLWHKYAQELWFSKTNITTHQKWSNDPSHGKRSQWTYYCVVIYKKKLPKWGSMKKSFLKKMNKT